MKYVGQVGYRGMTLIEMLVVMALLAGFFMMSVPFIKKREHVIQRTFRQMKALNRQLDSQARLNGMTYRLVVVLGLQKEGGNWWVERKATVEPSIRSEINPSETNPLETDQLKDSSSISIEGEDGFVLDESFFKEPQKLPEALSFESISFSGQQREKQISSGRAYIYYLQEGQSHKILLKIKGKKQYWSLLFDRLRGELDVLLGNKTWQELPL